MRKIYIISSIFSVLFATVARGELLQQNIPSKEADVAYQKLAGVQFITGDSRVIFNTQKSGSRDVRPSTPATKSTQPTKPQCDVSVYPYMVELDGEKGEVITCNDNAGPHYGYKTCKNGFVMNNKDCVENPCEDYNFPSSVEHCAGATESCQRGKNLVYKCSECEKGYKLNSEGGCTAESCDSQVYPYRNEIPTSCEGEAVSCQSGEVTYYGCKKCKSAGYNQTGGRCDIIICPEGYSSDCPANSDCEKCQSGQLTKYKFSRCKDGFDFVDGQCKEKIEEPKEDDSLCQGYSAFEKCDIPYCVHDTNGTRIRDMSCTRRVEKCQKGSETVYKCAQCRPDYVLNEKGGCSCDPEKFPYEEKPSHCDEPESCGDCKDKGGFCREFTSDENIVKHYGCAKCVEGYTLVGRHCEVTDCGEGYKEKCPDGAVCQTCRSGEDYKYHKTACQNGYKEDKDGNCVATGKPRDNSSGSVSYTIKTERSKQKHTLTIVGDFIIDWGDGHVESGTGPGAEQEIVHKDGDIYGGYKVSGEDRFSHTYEAPGEYKIVVTGTPTFVSPSDSRMITKLHDFSLSSIIYARAMFSMAENMTGDITHMSFPKGLINGTNMFYKCKKLTGEIPPFPDTLVYGTNMFLDCRELSGKIPPLPKNLKSGGAMFVRCRNLTGFGFTEFPSNLWFAGTMFQDCFGLSGPIPKLPESLTSARQMFGECVNLTGDVPALPKNLKDGYLMFYGCLKLGGKCSEKPASLKDASYIYGCTNITCSYGTGAGNKTGVCSEKLGIVNPEEDQHPMFGGYADYSKWDD